VHATLVAALWTANRTLDLARGVVDSIAYRAAVAAVDGASSALSASENTVAATSRAANNGLETAKRTGEAGVNAALSAVEFARKHGPEAVAYSLAQNELKVFEAGVDGTLRGFTAAVDGLWKSSEYVAFGAAQGAVSLASSTLKAIDAKIAAAGATSLLEKGVVAAVDAEIKTGTTICNVREVTIDGDLRNLVEGKESLRARVRAEIVGKEMNLDVDFVLGDAEKFLSDLWPEVLKALKMIVSGGLLPPFITLV
jgi:hypothetical protein